MSLFFHSSKLTARISRRFIGLFYKTNRPSLNGLEKKLEKYIDFDNGFFIEAGANNGYSQSNTYYLEKKRGWHGLLIEGIPALSEKCRQTRTKSIVVNCALVANDYPEKTVEMHYANLMSLVDGARKSSDEQRKFLKKGAEVQKLNETYSAIVPALTLESILDDNFTMPVIDLFSLDVEGYELNVLKGMNINKYRPKYILVEATFFDEVNDFLVANRYMLVEKLSGHDYLYRPIG